MSPTRLIVLVVFMVAVAGVAMVAIVALPLGGSDEVATSARQSESPAARPSRDPLEEPVAGPTESAAPPAKRLFEVHAWSRGDGRSLRTAVAANAIDEVDFDWYHSRADGSLKPEGEDLALVRRAQKSGVRALMTVTNRKDHESPFDPKISAPILASAQSRAEHVDVLVQACLEKGFDGVDMDWEMMYPADRDRFSQFVEELAKRLHAEDKILSIAVFPKTSEPGDWDSQKSEDYERLGAAVDEFKVMTYSFSGGWSEPGPQAPLEWTSEVLAFAATQVPPRKIYMGVPFYGFVWHGDTAETFYAREIERLQEKYLLETRRDRASGEAVTTWTDEKGVKHVAYYTDERALRVKLDLMVKDNPEIAGIAIWVMGEEQPEVWGLIARQLAE